jgi:hypothetical protein
MMTQAFISNDLGELVLWAGLIAMFIVTLIVVYVYVPDEKKKE